MSRRCSATRRAGWPGQIKVAFRPSAREIAIFPVQMIDPEAGRAGPTLSRIPQEILCLSIDIAKSHVPPTSPPENHLNRFHQFPVALLAAFEFERLRGKAPVDERGQYREKQNHERDAADTDDAERGDFY